ncbi:DNA topoisomerase IV subunit B [Erysipelothrix urinaevulpis]|uniref:DNA topoisomerase IV subunit B n=1 Tax=Erysipelothrix urinaevulpis TaxID=2683717 RepID=UPI00135CCDDD|nr:DNA topoisomerase IV subunit B [Erysipelothrix urinaevulpis]
MSNTEYTASSIEILEGLDAVRKRPGMYIGSTDQKGLHHLVWEIVDNAIDEALNQHGKNIYINIEDDQTISIRDEGRGMPVEAHQSGVSALEVIFTVLHAGGKFSEAGGYKTSGGLHGVGASVVNALSASLVATVYKGNQAYTMEFENGGKPKGSLKKETSKETQGSFVRFSADPLIFGNARFNYNTICERVQESAFLLEGIRFVVSDQRIDQTREFRYENGLREFMAYIHEDTEVLNETILLEGEQNDINVKMALQYNGGYHEDTYAYVNLVRTQDGGTHVAGFRSGLTKVVNEYARKHGVLKEKDKNFEGNDIREGLSLILSVSIPENLLQFEGQTKGKLGTPSARNAVEGVLLEQLPYYFDTHHEDAMNILAKIQKASQARLAARKAREQARKGKGRRIEKILSGKLANAQTKNKDKNELFLVEGDSAGGSAKQGRDSKFQAILPLRGKVLNTQKAKFEEILKNEELNTIIHTVGAGVGQDFVLKDSNYKKIIIMTDADTDGAHIQVLLLTFFFRHMRPLIEAGYVYIAQPPLYRVKAGKESFYCYTEDELDDLRDKYGKLELQRYKGLGEMNADQLWETTMDPQTRNLIQVQIDDQLIADKRVSTLMGDKVGIRREWIEENVSFTLEEELNVE